MSRNDKQTVTNIIQDLDLPKDLFLGLPNISLVGNTEVYISNHRGILSYDEEMTNVLVKDYQIQIRGRDLSIFAYTKDDLTIRGFIRSLEFL